MHFDPSGLYSAFDKLREDASGQGKQLADVLAAGFLKDMKDEGRKIAPTPEELTAKAVELKWRLKRKPGVTPAKELARRIRAKGTFARGWIIAKVESEKFRVRIWLVDRSSQSDKVDTEKKVSDRAEKMTGNKFKTKLDALASKLCGGF